MYKEKYLNEKEQKVLISFCGESKDEEEVSKLLEKNKTDYKVEVIYQTMTRKELDECETNKYKASAGKYYYATKISGDNDKKIEEQTEGATSNTQQTQRIQSHL